MCCVMLGHGVVRYVGTHITDGRTASCLSEYTVVAVIILLSNVVVPIGLPDCTVLYSRITNMCTAVNSLYLISNKKDFSK
jgi:hypothetical protein